VISDQPEQNKSLAEQAVVFSPDHPVVLASDLLQAEHVEQCDLAAIPEQHWFNPGEVKPRDLDTMLR
jgi:hypothetical protein